MKGIDVTDRQMETAENLLLSTNDQGYTSIAPEQLISMPWSRLVRLVAWYGQIRAEAVSEGGSVHLPEVPVNLTKEKQSE